MGVLGSRTERLRVASVISIVVAISSIVLFDLPTLAGGSSQSQDPFALVLGSFATDVVALVASFGSLRRQRWGVVALIVVQAFWALQAADAVLNGPAPLGATMLAVALLCLWCCLARDGAPVGRAPGTDPRLDGVGPQ